MEHTEPLTLHAVRGGLTSAALGQGCAPSSGPSPRAWHELSKGVQETTLIHTEHYNPSSPQGDP